MDFEQRFGFPVVRLATIEAFVNQSSARRWQFIKAIPADEYLRYDLSAVQQEEVRRFFPHMEAAIFRNPAGEFQTYFRQQRKRRYTLVFSLLPGDLVPATVSFRQGKERILLLLPGGMVDPGESPAACAEREFLAEMGILLERVDLLGYPSGLPPHAQLVGDLVWNYLGTPALPIVPKASRLEQGEFLDKMLVPLDDWVELLTGSPYAEPNSITTTFLALKHLGRFSRR